MKKPAVAGIATKIKLEENKMLIVTKRSDIGYYDEERDIFIDSKSHEFKSSIEKDKTCYMDLQLVEDLKMNNINPREYANSIQKMICYIVDDKRLLLDRNELEQIFEQYKVQEEQPLPLIDDADSICEIISLTCKEIENGKYTKSELQEMRDQLIMIQYNIDILVDTIDKETKKAPYQYTYLN